MYDTYVTVVGNALHHPEWRKTASGAMVTTFRVASTARRRSRETGEWVDGNSFRVRVSCWRALAWNVKESVTVGDPLIITGRLFTRDWVDEGGARRTAYELEARTVGHDLSRGRTVFERKKAASATSATEDSDGERRVGGEPTEPVPDDEAPAHFNSVSYQAAFEQPEPGPLPDRPDPVGALNDGGFTTEVLAPAAADGERELAVAEPEPPTVVPVPEDVAEGDEPEPEPVELDESEAAGGASGSSRPVRHRNLRRRV